LYKKFDSTKQGISKHDVVHLLKEAGHFIDESTKKRVYSEVEVKGLKKVDFQNLLEFAAMIKDIEEEEDQVNDDYVDAFVALGG